MELNKRIYYNKLVRDGIQAKIEGKGELCMVRTIEDDAEFQQELLKKIKEESVGLANARTREEFIDEYTDLMIVLDALTSHLEIAPAELELAMKENVTKKGWYKERHFLHWSEDVNYKSNETPQGIT